MLAIILLINSCCSSNLYFFYLVGSAAGSGFGLRVGIFSKFFIGNNLLLKLLRTLSLALNNNPKLFKKNSFSIAFFLLSSKLFTLAAKLLYSSSTSFNNKCP